MALLGAIFCAVVWTLAGQLVEKDRANRTVTSVGPHAEEAEPAGKSRSVPKSSEDTPNGDCNNNKVSAGRDASFTCKPQPEDGAKQE